MKILKTTLLLFFLNSNASNLENFNSAEANSIKEETNQISKLSTNTGTFFEAFSDEINLSALEINQKINASNSIIYVEIDEFLSDKQHFDEKIIVLENALINGQKVILETESYNVSGLLDLLSILDPNYKNNVGFDVIVQAYIDKSGFLNVDKVNFEQLSLQLGYKKPSNTLSKSAPDNYYDLTPVAGIRKEHLLMSHFAYDDSPPTEFRKAAGARYRYALRKNYTLLDIWKVQVNRNHAWRNTNTCIVAWRGTVPSWSDPTDVYDDFSSQGVTSHLHGTPSTSYGGRGFVRRVNEVAEFVEDDLSELDCVNIQNTGHSLGGALSSLFTYRIMHNDDFTADFLSAFNAPNYANRSMRNDFRSLASDNGVSFRIYNRSHDAVVNSIPTGLRRFGHTTSSVKDVTYVGGAHHWIGWANHGLALWWNED